MGKLSDEMRAVEEKVEKLDVNLLSEMRSLRYRVDDLETSARYRREGILTLIYKLVEQRGPREVALLLGDEDITL